MRLSLDPVVPIGNDSKKDIYSTKEIISVFFYNRNETETVLADQLKQATNVYYPSRIYGNQFYFIRLY
jgi:hypothetical protein